MSEHREKAIGFDYMHNNRLIIESNSFNDFLNYLFSSSFKIGQIKQGISPEKLEPYDMFIIGNPYNSEFTPEEIEALEEYVKSGHGLLIVSDAGGDYLNETNLNELTRYFGFKFNADTLYDSVFYVKEQDKPIITNIEPHFVTKDVKQFVHASGSTITVDDSVEVDEDIEVTVLAKSGLNAYIKLADESDDLEIDAPYRPVLVAVNYYNGRVIGLGNLAIFSSLSSYYGFNALDNSILVSNIINWLVSTTDEEGVQKETRLMSIDINTSLAMWMEKLIEEKEWKRTADIINFALKYFKDHYDAIMKETKERLKRLKVIREKRKRELEMRKRQIEEKRKEIMESVEESILELVDNSSRAEDEEKTLNDILKEISRISGDKE